jgi:hypothetical protein
LPYSEMHTISKANLFHMFSKYLLKVEFIDILSFASNTFVN